VTTALKLSSMLSGLGDEGEAARSNPIAEALGEYLSYDFMVTRLQSGCRTDGTATRRWGASFEAMLASLEFKKEFGMGGDCPYLQSGAYFIEFIRKYEYSTVSRLSRLPSLLIYVAGPYFGVAGAAFLGLSGHGASVA